MKIALVGGGTSLGHSTPNLAVAHELKKLQPSVQTIFIGLHGDPFKDVAKAHDAIDKVYSVRAGKLRRYHGAGLKQLLDLPTVFKNIRDAWWVFVGFVQAYILLRKLKPNCIFIKGGYVGVPVGLAAAALHIPFVTHDSDAIPGLANRIIARWAAMHAVALSKEVYPYPQTKTVSVGVPVQPEFTLVTPEAQKAAKQELGLEQYGKIVFVTGGGQGAQRLNDAVVAITATILREFPDLAIILLAGRANEEAIKNAYEKLLTPGDKERVLILGFVTNLYVYSAAADLIITRAGATTMAEFAIQQKPCLIVPNPFLTGGHQLKNAQYFVDKQAAVSVTEEELSKDMNKLEIVIADLLKSAQDRNKLATNLGKLAHPNAAKELAMVLLDQAAKPKS